MIYDRYFLYLKCVQCISQCIFEVSLPTMSQKSDSCGKAKGLRAQSALSSE